jgi:hypothetical protein
MDKPFLIPDAPPPPARNLASKTLSLFPDGFAPGLEKPAVFSSVCPPTEQPLAY